MLDFVYIYAIIVMSSQKHSLDELSRWIVDSLKQFVTSGDQSVSKKRKAELVSLAYAYACSVVCPSLRLAEID